MLLGNKCDLDEAEIDRAKLDDYWLVNKFGQLYGCMYVYEIFYSTMLLWAVSISVYFIFVKKVVKSSKESYTSIIMSSKERGFAGWFDTSAKQNINIDKAARFLVDQILLHKDIFVQKKASQVQL